MHDTRQFQQIAATYPAVNTETENAITFVFTGLIELASQYPGLLPHITAMETILNHVFPMDEKGNSHVNPGAIHMLEVGEKAGYWEVDDDTTDIEANPPRFN